MGFFSVKSCLHSRITMKSSYLMNRIFATQVYKNILPRITVTVELLPYLVFFWPPSAHFAI